MRELRTNTATRVTVGPFYDKTDGVTPETALTVTNCKLTFTCDVSGVPTLVLDTNPTASGGSNDMIHVSGDDAGFYDLEFAAADVNYLGRAYLALTDAANHCPVFHEFQITTAVEYDRKYATSGGNLPNAVAGASGGVPLSADASGRVDLGKVAGSTISLESFGIFEMGTPSAATASTLTLQSAHLFGTNTLKGAQVFVKGSTQGYWQANTALSNTSADPCVITFADNWVVTPSGTLTSVIIGTAPTSIANPPGVDVLKISGDATAADNAEAFFDGTGYAGTNNVIPLVSAVTLLNSVAAGVVTSVQSGLATAAALDTVDNFLDTEVSTIVSELAKVPKSDSTVSWNATAIAAMQSGLATAAALTIVDDFLDTEMAAVTTELAKVPKSDSTVSWNATAIAAMADGFLDRNMATGTDSGSPTIRTVRQALRVMRNRWSISGTTATYYKEDDITESHTAVLTATPGADPVTGVNPAG